MPKGVYDRKKYSPEMVADVQRLYYDDGHTQVEVAELLGTTQRVIFNLMRRHNLPSRGLGKRHQRGEQNALWKGPDATYEALHYRVRNLRGRPRACEICGTTDPLKTYNWANLSGKYDDPNDYRRMCRSCHNKHDKIAQNLGEYAQKKGES